MKNVEVVCAVIKNKDNKIFVCERGPGRALEGFWEFPGGKREEGETNEEALIREIEEELDSLIKVDKYLMTVEHTYPDMPPYKGFHITMHAYLCELIKGKLELSEHIAAKWADENDLRSLEFADADKPIVEKLLK